MVLILRPIRPSMAKDKNFLFGLASDLSFFPQFPPLTSWNELITGKKMRSRIKQIIAEEVKDIIHKYRSNQSMSLLRRSTKLIGFPVRDRL